MMQYMMLFFGVIAAIYLLIQWLQLFFLYRYEAKLSAEPTQWPAISIWIAARDEEANIHRCLASLLAMDYPLENLEILVGNDQSLDNTRAIVIELSKHHPQIKLIEVQDKEDGLKAKARVMAQMDKHATGEYYLITDADVWVNPQWAKTMLRSLWKSADVSNGGSNKIIGVCSGTTLVKSPNTWGWLQEIDWSYFMGLLNIISYAGVPATAVGNNMIISKNAYWATGGYSQIKFSITEDYKLYSEVCRKGFGWNNVMHPGVVAYSAETKGFVPLLHQRKRWLSGGKELPWYWWILFGVFGGFHVGTFFMVCLIPIHFFSIRLFPEKYLIAVFVALLFKWILQTLQIKKIYKNIGVPAPALWKLICYEPFIQFVTVSTALFFIAPIKTIWKGRAY